MMSSTCSDRDEVLSQSLLWSSTVDCPSTSIDISTQVSATIRNIAKFTLNMLPNCRPYSIMLPCHVGLIKTWQSARNTIIVHDAIKELDKRNSITMFVYNTRVRKLQLDKWVWCLGSVSMSAMPHWTALYLYPTNSLLCRWRSDYLTRFTHTALTKFIQSACTLADTVVWHSLIQTRDLVVFFAKAFPI